MQRQSKQVPDRGRETGYWNDLVSHPDKNVSGYINFENALELENRFDFSTVEFSRKNAWWLAEASFLAYWLDDGKVGEIYRKNAGLECVPLSRGSTQCHLAFDKDFAIVAFRGTQSGQWGDLVDDALCALADWTTGEVHFGFKGAFQRIAADLRDAIETHAPGRPLWLTGHSLGAALAVLAADALADRFDIRGLCLFGCPRVGNRAFTDHCRQRFRGKSFSFVHGQDIVTHAPPERFFNNNYFEVEERRSIQRDGTISTAPPPPLNLLNALGNPFGILRQMKSIMDGQHPAMPDSLMDHAPVLYVTHTWNDLVKNP